MKRYALTTIEGTAASETCLCENHFTDGGKKFALWQAHNDATLPFVDVTENNACSCIVCGNNEPQDVSNEFIHSL